MCISDMDEIKTSSSVVLYAHRNYKAYWGRANGGGGRGDDDVELTVLRFRADILLLLTNILGTKGRRGREKELKYEIKTDSIVK